MNPNQNIEDKVTGAISTSNGKYVVGLLPCLLQITPIDDLPQGYGCFQISFNNGGSNKTEENTSKAEAQPLKVLGKKAKVTRRKPSTSKPTKRPNMNKRNNAKMAKEDNHLLTQETRACLMRESAICALQMQK
jgi:hypothetical protein